MEPELDTSTHLYTIRQVLNSYMMGSIFRFHSLRIKTVPHYDYSFISDFPFSIQAIVLWELIKAISGSVSFIGRLHWASLPGRIEGPDVFNV